MADTQAGATHDGAAGGEVLDEEEWDGDLSDCPYFARYGRLPGHDPEGTCAYSCVDEPACITEEPAEGWPKASILWPSKPPAASDRGAEERTAPAHAGIERQAGLDTRPSSAPHPAASQVDG